VKKLQIKGFRGKEMEMIKVYLGLIKKIEKDRLQIKLQLKDISVICLFQGCK